MKFPHLLKKGLFKSKGQKPYIITVHGKTPCPVDEKVFTSYETFYRYNKRLGSPGDANAYVNSNGMSLAEYVMNTPDGEGRKSEPGLKDKIGTVDYKTKQALSDVIRRCDIYNYLVYDGIFLPGYDKSKFTRLQYNDYLGWATGHVYDVKVLDSPEFKENQLTEYVDSEADVPKYPIVKSYRIYDSDWNSSYSHCHSEKEKLDSERLILGKYYKYEDIAPMLCHYDMYFGPYFAKYDFMKYQVDVDYGTVWRYKEYREDNFAYAPNFEFEQFYKVLSSLKFKNNKPFSSVIRIEDLGIEHTNLEAALIKSKGFDSLISIRPYGAVIVTPTEFKEQTFQMRADFVAEYIDFHKEVEPSKYKFTITSWSVGYGDKIFRSTMPITWTESSPPDLSELQNVLKAI